MTRINVQRDGQDAFAPFTGPAELVQTSPGAWSTGSEIPLASFEPGYYTFMITVRDLNSAKGSAANKGIERKEDFVVLMPDGSDAAEGGRQARGAGQAEEAVSQGRCRRGGPWATRATYGKWWRWPPARGKPRPSATRPARSPAPSPSSRSRCRGR